MWAPHWVSWMACFERVEQISPPKCTVVRSSDSVNIKKSAQLFRIVLLDFISNTSSLLYCLLLSTARCGHQLEGGSDFWIRHNISRMKRFHCQHIVIWNKYIFTTFLSIGSIVVGVGSYNCYFLFILSADTLFFVVCCSFSWYLFIFGFLGSGQLDAIIIWQTHLHFQFFTFNYIARKDSLSSNVVRNL